MGQFPPVLKSFGSAPATVTEEMVSGTACSLVSVTDWPALVVPTNWAGKVSEELESTTGWTAFAVRLTAVGLPDALYEMFIVPFCGPREGGVRLTPIWQLWPEGSVAGANGQVVLGALSE